MDVKGSAARGRRMFLSVRNRLANAAALALLAIIGLGWSGQSHAQSCDFVQLGAPSAISLAGTSVSFTLEAQTACSPTVDVTLVVTADTTGGATVAAPANPTVNLDTPYVFTVNLGATPGGTGTVVATCQSGGCTGDQLVYTFATNNNFVFTAVAPAVVTNQITPFTLTTNFQLNGAPGALNTSFFNVTTSAPIGAAVAPDAAGSASITSSIAIANTYNITGSINCPALFLLEGCPPPPANFTVLVEPVSVTPTTPLAPATPSGTPLNMAVGFGSASIPAPDGTNINWSVTAQPAGGDGAVAGNAVAGGGGQSTAVFTATVPGTYTVVANSGCTFCAPGLRAFTVTVTAVPYVLVPVTANPLSGTAGVGIPVTVRLEQGGLPVAGATIEWSSNVPFSPSNINSVSNGLGEASATFTPSAPGNFTNAVVAFVDIDGIPASGDEATFIYDANIALGASLAITGGNSQNASPGAAFAGPLQVNALNSGVPAPGVTINWAVTSGSAVLSAPTSVTDAAGNAAIGVTAGATAGPVTITGTRQDDATATVTFNLTVSALPYVLVPVSANPLSGTAGVGIPVTVRLEQGGVPVGGATVQWSASAPFAPANTSSVTNAAAGEASATFTPSTFGSFTNAITASVDIDGIPASGDEATFTYDANIAFVASLAITGGNSQNALVNAAFAGPLQVNALNSGVAAPGVTINWAVTSGSAVLSAPTSVTDAAGNAAIGVTAGATAGPATITGTRQDAPSATATFTLSVDALGSLAVIGGDGQLLASGVASAPLQVKLTNAAGLPVAGAVVAWTTSTGTLASASSTTNATGVASNTVITTTAGAVQVSASSPLATAPAVFALNGALASLGGLTGTQREVAQAIDAACPALANLGTLSAGQQDLLARCRELIVAAGIDPTATIAALDQLMADVALTQANAAFSAAQSQFINLKTRIAALRSGTGGTDFGGLAINTSMGPVSLGTLAGAFSNSAAEAGTEVGTDFSRWGFFAAGTVGRGEAEAGSVNPAYDFDVEGITAGVDYRKSDKWIIGGSFGYTRQDTQLPDDRGGLDTTGWSLSAYTTFYQADSWYLDGVLTYGRNDYELLRQISYTLPLAGGGTTSINQVAQSDAGGDLLSTAFTVGRDWNFGAFGVGPYARALYTRLGFDDIDEELVPGLPGSGLGLRIENRDVTSLASVLGAKFTYTHSTGWGVLMPHLQLEWEHEFEDDPQAIEARFINDPTGSAMLVRGDPLDTNYFRLGFGLSMVLTRGRSGFFYYERLTGMNGMSQDNLALGFRMEF
jgi:uncharacterized protein with beta-barrel porin domain